MADPHAWAESFFALVDRFDADAVASRMTPRGVLISVNNEPVVGRDGMRDAIHSFERAVASISHEVLRAWQVDIHEQGAGLRVKPCNEQTDTRT